MTRPIYNQTRDIQRTALHSIIWKVADELRGSVDGWDFKMYVLGFLFYRFISENLAEYINANMREYDNMDLIIRT